MFTRRELREREQKELDMLAARMQNDIAFVALEGSGRQPVRSGLGAQRRTALAFAAARRRKAVGRLVINLPRLLRSPIGSPYDVVLRDGDELFVPKFEQEVTVIGEVQSVTSHLYRPGLTRNDYIAMSGGETQRADNSRVYVVRADGSVVVGKQRLVPKFRQRSHPAGRYRGRAAERRAHTGVAAVDSGHADPLQRRDRDSGSARGLSGRPVRTASQFGPAAV